jgi:hypothetical protein
MRTDADCTFCKIIAGQMPCFKLLEDDDTLAFMDIYPANDGHSAGTGADLKVRIGLTAGGGSHERTRL